MADQERGKDKGKKSKKGKGKKVILQESPPPEGAVAKSSLEEMQKMFDNPDVDEPDVVEEEPAVQESTEDEIALKQKKSLKLSRTQSMLKKSQATLNAQSASRMKILQDKAKSAMSMSDKTKSTVNMTSVDEEEEKPASDGKKKKKKKDKGSKKSKKGAAEAPNAKESILNLDEEDDTVERKKQVTIQGKDRDSFKKGKYLDGSGSAGGLQVVMKHNSNIMRSSVVSRSSRSSRESRVSSASRTSHSYVCTSSSSSYSDHDMPVEKKTGKGVNASAVGLQVDAKDKVKGAKKKKPVVKETPALVEDLEVIERIFEPSATSDTIIEEPKKEKKPKGKKAAKKKKKKEKPKEPPTEEELKRIAEEERVKRSAEKRDAIAKEKKELQEAAVRAEQLEIVMGLKAASEEAHNAVVNEEQAAEEWRQYLVCDGLPAPWDVPGMNTYLHLWEQEIPSVTVDRCRERTAEAISLLEKLEDIIEDPFDTPERRFNDWKWVATLFREHQEKNLEFCTYRLLRDIKTKLNRISISSADYRFKDNLLSMCLHVSVTLPTPVPSVRTASRNKIILNWVEINVNIVFPPTLKCDLLAIRGMYLRYDHLSDTCLSYNCPQPLPAYYTKTLKSACREQLIFKQRYKYDRRVNAQKEEIVGTEDGAEVVVEEEEVIPPDEMPPLVPYQKLEPSASAVLLETINSEMENALYSLVIENLPEHIINLRQFSVLGGIYCLDLFIQPPQPQGMVSYEVSLATLIEPLEIQRSPFVLKREAPEIIELRSTITKSDFRSLIAFSQVEIQYERELDELIAITLNVPNHVYLLDNPIVVQWDDEYNSWGTQNIFNSAFNPERGTMQFRTNQFRPVALAIYRWLNIPYKTWEIRPEPDGTVSLLLAAAILKIEFHVKGVSVCVKAIQSAPNNSFDQHLGVYYRFSKLRKIMRNTGIDVFPYFDTFLYAENCCEKYWPMEDHLYLCMAYISTCYNMIWSKWNATVDPFSIVFLSRLLRYDRHKQAEFDTILVQNTRCLCVCCTEESEQFSDEPMEGMRFFADLWQMTRSTTTKAIKTRIATADQTMVNILYRLYKSIRFISFSNQIQ